MSRKKTEPIEDICLRLEREGLSILSLKTNILCDIKQLDIFLEDSK
jgi:hypothetical protein